MEIRTKSKFRPLLLRSEWSVQSFHLPFMPHLFPRPFFSLQTHGPAFSPAGQLVPAATSWYIVSPWPTGCSPRCLRGWLLQIIQASHLLWGAGAVLAPHTPHHPRSSLHCIAFCRMYHK